MTSSIAPAARISRGVDTPNAAALISIASAPHRLPNETFLVGSAATKKAAATQRNHTPVYDKCYHCTGGYAFTAFEAVQHREAVAEHTRKSAQHHAYVAA